MLKIHDVSLDNFIDIVSEKNLFIWGAGVRAARFVNECDIKKNLVAVVDNNIRRKGDIFYQDEVRMIKIIDVTSFITQVNKIGKDNMVLLITPIFDAEDILKQLDEIKELDGMNCFLGELLCSFYVKHEIRYTKGDLLIPKKIHYCWFGGHEIPSKLQKCIDSWYVQCPDYEIIRWDEHNYDVTKNQYMKEAYECKKWGFVPDYARLDIIYNEGGIYLDTDVELLDHLDKFLADEMFCGFSGEMCIAMGLAFGAVKNHDFLKELRNVYNNKNFCMENGMLNLRSCVEYQHPVFKAHGFSLRNKYQNIDHVAIYPSEVFSPSGIVGERNNYTEHTVSIHHGSLSWISQKQRNSCLIYKNIRLVKQK